jgi:DNA-directed RNA polymerase specialized sigma subunit
MKAMSETEKYKDLEVGSEKLIELLVSENMGWAESIARSVARAWNLDWQLDGLDGGAFEALLFCARRFDPKLGVPFRAYARKRIHEGSTEEARKSKAWQRGVGAGHGGEDESREISYRLFEVFPELREGYLPASAETEDDLRTAIRQLLTSASVIAAFQEGGIHNPELAVDYKSMLEYLAELEPIHQAIMWSLYWGGQSMRSLAEEWEIDELTIIREHREILAHLSTRFAAGRLKQLKKLKIRPSLRAVALQMRKKKAEPPFSRFTVSAATALGLFLLSAAIQGELLIQWGHAWESIGNLYTGSIV